MKIRSLAERGNRVPATRRHGFWWTRYWDEEMERATWMLNKRVNGQRHTVRVDVDDVIFRDAAVRGDQMTAWALCKARRQLREGNVE